MVKIKTSSKESDGEEGEDNVQELSESGAPRSPDVSRSSSPDRYFVCKSLTIEDLHASVRLGLWDTQSHNITIFNNAFKVRFSMRGKF